MEKTATQTAIESYDKDHRFRMIVQSTVAAVMQDHGPVDPERADRDAHDIAIHVGALLYQRIYDEDRELAMLKAERDHYKQVVEKLMLTTPQPIFIPR